MRNLTADRSMRARKRSVCHLCWSLINVSQRIVRVRDDDGRPLWVHVSCCVPVRRVTLNGRPVETLMRSL